jgi:hypothetical protein
LTGVKKQDTTGVQRGLEHTLQKRINIIATTTANIIFKKQMQLKPAKEIEVAHANERG